MDIELIREYFPNGVNGELFFNGNKICNTIELPWRNNERRISCIPEGRYQITKRYTLKFSWHYLVHNVPNRDYILIHSFNNALKECYGCIAPVTTIEGQGIGGLSRRALRKLMSILTPGFDHHETIFITIKSKKNDDSKKSAEANAKLF